MTDKINERLERAVNDVFEANIQYFSVMFDIDAVQALGTPCPESKVRQLESELGQPLPPSYRAFLLKYGGWQNFSGDAHILSVDQRKLPSIVSHLLEFRTICKEFGDNREANGFVIVAGEASTYFVYLDLLTRQQDGEVDVVEYGYNEGELARHQDFVLYLEQKRDSLHRLIARETGMESYSK